MSAPLFAFADIVGGYGDSMVVHGLAGTADRGEALCVLGRNGVGKSTLMKLLYGFLPVRTGSVRLNGTDIARARPDARREAGISYCPQERIVFDDLDVYDNLMLMSPKRGLDHLGPYFERFPRLRERLGQHAGTLSGGERKLLSFVRAFAEDQPLTLIDEPTEGVQKENVSHMIALVNARKKAGGAFVIVEQNLAFVEAVADRYLIVDQGREVLAGAQGEIGRTDIVRHLSV